MWFSNVLEACRAGALDEDDYNFEHRDEREVGDDGDQENDNVDDKLKRMRRRALSGLNQ